MRCFIRVSDPADPRLTDYVRLTDAELRKSLEAEHGLFVAEGEKVIRRAAAAGYRVRSLLATEQKAAGLADLAAACGGPAYVVPAPVAEQLTGYHVHRGALAAMDRRPLPPVATVLAGVRTALILEDIVDHTNVGAIFRCAAALGVGAVIVSPRCADPLYRRSVKVSMGAVFAVPWARMDDWHGGLDTVRAAGFRLLALTPDPAAVPMTPAAPWPPGPEPAAAGSRGNGAAHGRAAHGQSRGADRAAAGHRGGWAFVALAAPGRPGGPHPHGPGCPGRGRGLAQRGRRGRDCLPVAGDPDRARRPVTACR